MARPVGSFGEIAKALLAAAHDGPADVRTLAARSMVGFDSAKYTVSRLVSRGSLVKEDDAVQRGCKFKLPNAAQADASRGLASALAAWSRNASSDAAP